MFNKLRDTDVEAFDSYLKGKMKEDELNAFKLRLADDASFRDSYLLYKMIIDKVKADAEVTANLKQRLFIVSKKSKRYTWLKWLTGTAAILVISFFAIKVTQHKQADYSKYMFEEPGLTVQMSAGTESKWASFNSAFAQKDYQECLKLLKKIGSNDTAMYYTGVCNEFLKQNIIQHELIKDDEKKDIKPEIKYEDKYLTEIRKINTANCMSITTRISAF
jgi:hypothetical protein